MKYYAEACTRSGKVFDTMEADHKFEIRVWSQARHADLVNVYLNNADGTLTLLEVWSYVYGNRG